MSEVRVIPIDGIPEVKEGDDVAELIVRAADEILDEDVVVVAHKVISKAEGRVADEVGRRSTALMESRRILRRSGPMLISETRHGFICANAGVDASNVAEGSVVMLPLDPDLSARRLRARVRALTDADVAVVISDTFGRPWRLGQTNVAIGVAGMDPFIDYRGQTDGSGRELSATRICTADEIAGAAELVMGKAKAVPAVIVRGARVRWGRGAAVDIVRPPGEDLFR